MGLETMLALMLVVNILMLMALMAFAYKLNKDWAEFAANVNRQWMAFAGMLMGAIDDSDVEKRSFGTDE